jgi:hypothetical protein
MSNTIRLAPGETMREFNARKQLFTDCGDVVRVIDRKPGLPSKDAIADETGLTVERVAACIRAIKRGKFPELHRVEYGTRKAKGGPFAGDEVTGWFPMRLSAYQGIMDDADAHERRVVRAIAFGRARRMVELRFGATTAEAKRALASIAERGGIDFSDPKFATVDEAELAALVAAELAV